MHRRGSHRGALLARPQADDLRKVVAAPDAIVLAFQAAAAWHCK